jgi:thioredoxin 1
MKPQAMIAVAVLVIAVGVVLAIKSNNRTSGEAVVQEAHPPAASGLPRLIDIGAGKCIPCKMMAPILEELKTLYKGKMDVVVIDITEMPAATKMFNVGLIPTQIFSDASGKELFRHEGFISKDEILAKWKELGFDFQKEVGK